MAATNHYKATVTLGAVTAGYLASYPFEASFAGGLISSGCVAAMIGGLADWFAITALFRNPLGIRWPHWLRTEIIPRNRDRLFHEIINMVENQLLTKEMLSRKLAAYDISALLLRFLQEHKGKQDLKQILHQIMTDLLEKVDSVEMGKLIEDVLKNNLTKLNIAPLLSEVVDYSIKSGYDEEIIEFVLGEIIKLLEHGKIIEVLTPLIEDVIAAYEKGMTRRKITHWLIGASGHLSTHGLALEAQSRAIQFIRRLKDPGHPLRQQLKDRIVQLAADLKSRPDLQEKMENWKTETVKRLNVHDQLAVWIEGFRKKSLTEVSSETKTWMTWVTDQLDRIIHNFAENPEQQRKIDTAIKQAVLPLVSQAHQKISEAVRVSLNELTNEKLVDFIQSKAGNDLQMIRINGSIVGGFVGMLIFIITYFLD
ncbi:MAG TPA: DUF445 domain-containing protein [Bacilli bacterium]